MYPSSEFKASINGDSPFERIDQSRKIFKTALGRTTLLKVLSLKKDKINDLKMLIRITRKQKIFSD